MVRVYFRFKTRAIPSWFNNTDSNRGREHQASASLVFAYTVTSHNSTEVHQEDF